VRGWRPNAAAHLSAKDFGGLPLPEYAAYIALERLALSTKLNAGSHFGLGLPDVYTPRFVNETANLPVMAFFHGGNFDKVRCYRLS